MTMLVVGALIVAAYLLGGLSPGWWLVRRQTGLDLRAQGSGSTGATNAARVLGNRWFVAVMVIDIAKGTAAVLAARWLAPDAPWALLAMPAVVAGHIWPVWLGFRGGRGAAPLLGSVFVLCWPAGLGSGLLALTAGLLAKKKFVGAATGYVAVVPLIWWLVPGVPERVVFGLAWLLVLLAHRDHLTKHRPSPAPQ